MTCPDCEYHKDRAALWRHEAYKLGGTPLPWDVDVVIARAVAAEREECGKVCEARYMGDNSREDMEAKRCAAAIRSRNA